MLISIRKGNISSELSKLPKNTSIWTKNAWPTFYKHWLDHQISFQHSIEKADGVELVKTIEIDRFSEKIVIQSKKSVLKVEKKYKARLIM